MTRRWQFFPKADVELGPRTVSRHTSGCATFALQTFVVAYLRSLPGW